MTEPTVPSRGPVFRTTALAVLAVGLTAATGLLAARCARDPGLTGHSAPEQAPVGSQPVVPAPFSQWPKDKTPDAVLVLTGQVYGFLKPCGCTPVQYGGLERRANLIQSLKAKGWHVGGLDLGDLTAESEPGHAVQMLPEQIHLKYKFMMQAMRDLGYAATGVGEKEFAQHLYPLLGQFTVQKPNDPPILLAANLAGTADGGKIVPREERGIL